MDTEGETIRQEVTDNIPGAQAGFDGELVVLADGEFSDDVEFSVVYADRRTDRIQNLDQNICILLAKYSALVSDALKRAPGRVESLQFDTNDLYANLKDMWGREVLDVILSGKIRLAFLIDSDGGDIDHVEIYKKAGQYLLDKGGMTEAFVTGHAASAGFELMALAQNIFLMDKAYLMWHFSDDEGDRRNQVQTLRERKHDQFRKFHELADLYKFLERSPFYNRAVQKRFFREITNPQNPEGELVFTTQELIEMEIASNYYERLRGMAADFAYCYDAASHKAVRDFWLYSDIMCREAEESGGVWQDKNFEESRKELRTKKISNRGRKYKRLFAAPNY